MDLLLTVMELNAIWFSEKKKIIRNSKSLTTVRLMKGDFLLIEDGEIKSAVGDKFTHEIVSCHGNVANTILFFYVQDVKTNEISRLKVK